MASIERRGESNSWRLIVEAGYDAHGKRLKRYKTIRVEDPSLLRTTKRLKEYLQEELVKFKIEVEAGEYIAPEKMTFSAFVNEWRTNYALKHLAERTLYTYESNLKTRIIPTFGHMRIDQIKPLHIIRFLDSLDKDNSRLGFREGRLSSGSIEIVHRVLKNIFSRAVEWKLIKENPLSGVKKPTVRYKQIIPYDNQEIQELLQALQKEPIHWRVIVTLALTSGLRRGELLGLEWHHINWDDGTLDVLQSVSLAPAGIAHVKEPKTRNSKRKVSLPTSMLEQLRYYYEVKSDERRMIGDKWKGGNYNFIFCHPDGRAFHQERPYLWFRNFLKKNNLRYIKFHTLRHTSATLLINQGVHAKIIAERLGHGSIQVTMNTYGFALRTADRAAAEKFESIINQMET
ncbi:integrase [Paenibacillus phyllosphaerae]|uniref:Integrase n=1 Tax=Paenibacillus phyllosphaerae TaxID=274593 RepID=A0A7W5B0N9_9BACL|nr:site-specific integrase [Paenibacillus phyllosphaerae]MBB3111954.1 integrase [Paenibacillus phyllosphaerae]